MTHWFLFLCFFSFSSDWLQTNKLLKEILDSATSLLFELICVVHQVNKRVSIAKVALNAFRILNYVDCTGSCGAVWNKRFCWTARAQIRAGTSDEERGNFLRLPRSFVRSLPNKIASYALVIYFPVIILIWVIEMHLTHRNLSFQANCFSVEDNVLNIFWLMKILEAQDQTVSVSY